MKVKRIVFLLVSTLLCAFASAQGFVIDDFNETIQLHTDGSMRVQESIAVTFSESKHGIYRVIPIDYEAKHGMTRRVVLSGITVTDGNNARLKTKLKREGSDLNIRIGDADILIPEGTQMTYVISYDVFGMMNWIGGDANWDSSAELYWNVTGNGWQVPIRHARVNVTFPDTEDGKKVRAIAYDGPYGTFGGHAQIGAGASTSEELLTRINLTSNSLDCECLRELNPYEGLTFALSMPANLIQRPSAWQQFLLIIMPNPGLLIPVFVLLVMPLVWLRYGKDPNHGPKVIQFEPVDGMSAAEMGTLIDEKVDQRDIAAIIVSLAVKGHLTITQQKGFLSSSADLDLIPRDDKSNLTVDEYKMLTYLEKCGPHITQTDLRETIAPRRMELQTLLYDSLISRGYYLQNPQNVKAAYSILGIIVVVVLCVFATAISSYKDPLPSLLGGVLSGIIVLTFASFMPRRTPMGAKTWSRVAGFQEFISRAQEPQLQWQTKLNPTQALFEEYLPYAVSFGMVKQWAGAFANILNEPPSWYNTNGGVWNPYIFGDNLSSVSHDLGNAASVPPRSSGASGGGSGFSSGGGFSGGGMGGGGGGSW